MAMQSYVVQYAFYVAALSESKIQIGEVIDYDLKTRKASYNGKEAMVPLMTTAIKEGWVLLESEVGKKIPVLPQTQVQGRYPVSAEKAPAGNVARRRGQMQGGVEAQDEKPVSQVRIFTAANVGALDIAKGDFQALQRQNQQAEAERLRLAAQNSQLPKVSYTEGVTVTTTTGNRANRPGNDQVWDGGTQSEVVGRVSDRNGEFRRVAAARLQQEETYEEEVYDEDVYDEDYGYDELPNSDDVYELESEELIDAQSLRDRMGIILNALPKAHQTDIKLHIAILQALIPGFPAWDPRAHWKKKVKAYQDEIEVNPNYVTALRLVETDAFWKHINK